MIIWPAAIAATGPWFTGPTLIATGAGGWDAVGIRNGGVLSDGSLIFLDASKRLFHSINQGASWTLVRTLAGAPAAFWGGMYDIDIHGDQIYVVGVGHEWDGVTEQWFVTFWRITYAPATRAFAEAVSGAFVLGHQTFQFGRPSVAVHTSGRIRVTHGDSSLLRVISHFSDDGGTTWTALHGGFWMGTTARHHLTRRGTELVDVFARGVTEVCAMLYAADTVAAVTTAATAPIASSGQPGGDITGHTAGLDQISAEPYYYYWRSDLRQWYWHRFGAGNAWTAFTIFTPLEAQRPPTGEAVSARMVHVDGRRFLCYAGTGTSTHLCYVTNEVGSSSVTALAIGSVPGGITAQPFNAVGRVLMFIYGLGNNSHSFAIEF